MPSPLTRFVEGITGASGRSTAPEVEDIAIDSDERVAVVFDDIEQVGVQMEADEAGLDVLDTQNAGDRQRAMILEDPNSGFFDDPMEANTNGRRLRPTEIQREPNGEFTYPRREIEPAPQSPADRAPNGQFVSNDLDDANIGRQESDGLFDLFR